MDVLADGDGVTTASEAEAYCKSSGINLKNRIHAREEHIYVGTALYLYSFQPDFLLSNYFEKSS